jgi:hypothetical protein
MKAKYNQMREALLLSPCLVLSGLLLAAQAVAMEVNTNRPGMDYKTFPIHLNPVICENICLNDPQCQAWTYVVPQVYGQSAICFLKNRVPYPVFDQCCISGTKGPNQVMPQDQGTYPGPFVNLPDLKIRNLDIAPRPDHSTGPLLLHMNRSYRFFVSILNRGAPSPAFTVRTECSRGGMPAKLGEFRVGPIPGGQSRDVVYDVFPGMAGVGNCMMRTTVDADREVNESDESPLNKTWDVVVTILP